MDELKQWVAMRIGQERRKVAATFRRIAAESIQEADRLGGITSDAIPNVEGINRALDEASVASVRAWALVEVMGQIGAIENKAKVDKTGHAS